jgi:serine/threonine protein kinase
MGSSRTSSSGARGSSAGSSSGTSSGARGKPKAITAEVLVDEVRFLLKTLLRDDLFGDTVAVAEAEKLLDNSLSIAFADYCAFLRDKGLITLDRRRGTVQVEPLGSMAAKMGPEPDLIAALVAHFSARITAGKSRAAPPMPPPMTGHGEADPGATQPLPIMGEQAALDAARGIAQPREPTRPAAPDVGARYDLGVKIGEGSVGVVYRAEDLTLERPVALKELSHVFDFVTYIPREELRRRLKDATLAQAKLECPHVLPIVDLDFAAYVPHVVVTYASGGNLAQRLERAAALGEPMPIDVTLRVLQQCAAGLAHAHARGVVHGGLKPENILFDAAGNVLLSDFGLVKVTAKGALTGPPVYVGAGSTSYMAPEQLHEEKVSPEGDVYALGILLYQMLTGQLPGRRSPMPSDKNKDCPSALDDLFDQMTMDAPGDRTSSAEAVLEALAKAVGPRQGFEAGQLTLNTVDPWPLPDLPPPSPAEDEVTAATEGTGLTLSSEEQDALADIPSEELPAEELVSADGDAKDAPSA